MIVRRLLCGGLRLAPRTYVAFEMDYLRASVAMRSGPAQKHPYSCGESPFALRTQVQVGSLHVLEKDISRYWDPH